MAKYEILPPERSNVPAPRSTRQPVVPTPRYNSGGIIESTLTRWEANVHQRTAVAVARRVRAEADLFDAQTQAVEAYIRRERAAHHLLELPEILAADRVRRRAERSEELRQLEHQRELADLRRATEVARVQAALVDAQQALRAQQEFGHTIYELEWKKKNCEMLDVELSAAERRAILREHLSEMGLPGEEAGTDHDAMDEALYEARAQLQANGLDTSRIDAVLERRRGRG